MKVKITGSYKLTFSRQEVYEALDMYRKSKIPPNGITPDYKFNESSLVLPSSVEEIYILYSGCY